MTNATENKKLQAKGAALLSALSDPTRRTIFDALIESPQVVKVIAADLPISQSAVSQHLKVMKNAGLVLEEKLGRTHRYSVDPVALDWLSWQFGLLRDDVLGAESEHRQGAVSEQYDVVDLAMEQWANEWPELDALANGLMVRFCLIGRHLEWLFERLAMRFGLTSSQVLLLSTLDRYPNQTSSIAELARTSFTQTSVAEQLIQSLIEKGLVEYVANDADVDLEARKEQRKFAMTSRGREMIHDVLNAQRMQEHAPIYKMEAEQRLAMAKMLRPLLRDLRETMKSDFVGDD